MVIIQAKWNCSNSAYATVPQFYMSGLLLLYNSTGGEYPTLQLQNTIPISLAFEE